MTNLTFEKTLTANDTGETGGHQAGVHIPKLQQELLALLPLLDPQVKNPDAWLEMIDDTGIKWTFRYIYYNNRWHEEGGTRDEYRITHMTKFFRAVGATAGDILVLSGAPHSNSYSIAVRKRVETELGVAPGRIQLKGWRRVH